ncbi:hypothetical protein AAIH46_09050 [Rhizobium sp. 0TCS1.26]|uniref:hypothetical protein n=1 Tax=Rhizobium sp. 0TCS1.26 TaxID=3142623 RepID=UPI003D2B9F3C
MARHVSVPVAFTNSRKGQQFRAAAELSSAGEVNVAMKNTDQKASGNMLRFVGTIFAIAIILAAIYFFFLTPEEAGAALAFS